MAQVQQDGGERKYPGIPVTRVNRLPDLAYYRAEDTRIMNGRMAKQLAATAVLAMALGVGPVAAQKQQKTASAPVPIQQFQALEQPDAQRTRTEFDRLLNRYPPTVRGVFRQDPNLLTQPQSLSVSPPLAAFLN